MATLAIADQGLVVVANGAASALRAGFLENSLSRIVCRLPRFVIREREKDGFLSRESKTDLSELSPFQDTLYLDADIIALRPFDEIWAKLEAHDLWMAPDIHRTVGGALADHSSRSTHEERNETRDVCGGESPFYNSGVILFRKTARVRELFEQWYLEWQKYRQVDQFALVRAIARCNYRPALLEPEYNWHFAAHQTDLSRVVFLHLWRVRGEDYAARAEELMERYIVAREEAPVDQRTNVIQEPG